MDPSLGCYFDFVEFQEALIDLVGALDHACDKTHAILLPIAKLAICTSLLEVS